MKCERVLNIINIFILKKELNANNLQLTLTEVDNRDAEGQDQQQRSQ